MARKSKYLSAQPLPETSVHYLAGQYGRLSVEDGDDTESNSIGNQAKIADAFLAEYPDIQIVERYADNGYTGMNYNRPAFRQMMADVRSGKINCIIIKDISRLGRHFVETSELVEQIFPAMSVRLISVNDNYDSLVQDAGAAASLTMPLKMVMNENYAKDISRKIRSSIHAQMRSGTYLPSSGSIPYGYLRNAAAASYDIDEDTAPVVRRIFALRSEGVSFNAIAKQLNQEHIPSPAQLRYLRGMNSSAAYRDALWSRATIRKIVGSDVYIGNRTYGKVSRNHLNEKKKRQPTEQWTVIPNAHPPIISKELFDAVQQVNQEVLASRAAYRTCADVGDVQADLFRGKLFCAECGSPMGAGKGCARHGAHSPSRLFYDCNRYRYSAHTVCSSHYIRHERLLAAVTDALDQQLALAVDVERLIHEIDHSAELTQAKQEKQNTATSLRLQRQGLDRKLDMLIHDLSTGLIGREEFLYAKEKYQAELNRILAAEVAQKERIEQMQKGLSTAQAWVCAMQEYGESTGGLELGITNLLNQLYSRDLSRKIKSVTDRKKLNGEYAFGAVPYGYQKGEQKNTIVVDPPAADVVRQIFQWASQGISITQIAQRLNASGTETPSVYLAKARGRYKVRKFWTYESVRNILQNRIYTGDTEAFKSHVVKVGSNRTKLLPEAERPIIPHTHEPIRRNPKICHSYS